MRKKLELENPLKVNKPKRKSGSNWPYIKTRRRLRNMSVYKR